MNKIRVIRKSIHRWEELKNGQVVQCTDQRSQVLFKGSEAAFNNWKKANELRPTDEIEKNYNGGKVDHKTRTILNLGGELE